MTDTLMRVFWPRDLPPSDRPGVVVGWRNTPLDVFVVAVLDDVDPVQVDVALKAGSLFRNARHPVARIYEACGHGASMHVLGVANQLDRIGGPGDSGWVRLTTEGRVPRVTCAAATSIQVVLFDRPLPVRMQYASLNPISLALDRQVVCGDGNENKNQENKTQDDSKEHNDDDDDPTDSDERKEMARRAEKQKLVAKLRQHLIFDRVPSDKEMALPQIISQINWAWELERLMQSNVSLIGARRRARAMSVTERVVESATTMRNYVLQQLWTLARIYVFPLLAQAAVLLLVAQRAAAEALLVVLEWRPSPHRRALKDVSATAQQLEIRLQQFCYWPFQFVMLHRRKRDWASMTGSHPDYIRFYNSLWLVANDVIIGIALGLYIIERADWVADRLGRLLSTWTVEALRSSIEWLMGWPAGLKLNSELATFLGDLFLWVIEYWSHGLDTLRPALPAIVWIVGVSSFAGASMPIAMASDLLSVLTMHVYSFYLASARIYHWQLTILRSLFHLFRGKKHNVLRNRIDACNYDLDQLLVGTILFTLLSFLLPTVAVFYLNFALARMAIISLKAAFDTMLSCLNHFPLFAIMLRLKDPRRLPGGIRFELQDGLPSRPDIDLPTSVIYLKSTPLPFGAIFNQYFQMAARLQGHYLSARVLICLLTGKLVPPINRKSLYSLQYSMLPARRAGVVDVWVALWGLCG